MGKSKWKMDVAHVAPMTPYRSGLYETTRELVEAERKLGINAHIIDSRPTKDQVMAVLKAELENKKKQRPKIALACPHCKGDFRTVLPMEIRGGAATRVADWTEDRGVCAAPMDFAAKSDIIVSHGGLTPELEKMFPPAIHVAHGWPRSSFLIEWQGGSPIYQMYLRMGKHDKYKAFVTLWPEYREYLEVLFPPEKLHVMPSFVNLDRWKVEGDEDYKFGGRKGDINVVIADIWRTTKDPYFAINAFMVFAKRHPDKNVKLHMYGIDEKMQAGWGMLIQRLEDLGWAGERLPVIGNKSYDELKQFHTVIDVEGKEIPLQRPPTKAGKVPTPLGMEAVYHSADMVLTTINSASRVVREGLACGRQVVAGHDCQWTPYNAYEQDLVAYADAMDQALQDWLSDKEGCINRNRAVAEQNFDVMESAKKFIELYEKVKAA